ncbi:hypothetical protein KRP22_013773 [Phytophthora ramorum]|nr:hypothetical protein KRP22_14153 [Phytophthora ramorum]
MSKMAASLLCDFVVPVVGGSIFEALSTMATLCGEMKENEVVCRRVYDRLRFVCEELQRCSDASSLHESRVLALYGCAISQFLEFLEKNSQKRLLRRLIESSRVAERIQEFHEEIDQLFKLLSIVHMAEMSVWRKEWEQDRTLQRNMLRDALAEARCVHNAGSPSNSLATLSTSTCSSDGSNSSEDQTLDVHAQGQKLLHGNDFLDTEQRLVVREKELEEAIRDHIAENGYDVCSVLNLLRSVPSASLALRGAVVLHELEVELQPEVLCLALPSFIQEFTHSLGGKSDPRSVYARQMAERYWVEWFPSYIRALVQGHGLVVENAAKSDILYAPGNEFKLDTTWRHIVTWTGDGIKWKPSEDELEAQWRLVPENDTKTLFRIVNFRYPYEWLYATSVACQEGNGITLALSSQPPRGRDESRAERAPEALWELQPVTGLGGGDSGSFSLFNPHTGGYLCTNEYNLDSQRRLVHILPQNAVSLSEAPTMRRCTWRLRTCTDQDADHHMKCLTGDGQDGCTSPPHVPEAAREFAALELVVRDLFESSGHDVGAVVAFIRKLPETKHILFACSIARALDVEASKNCTSRRDGLVLPFFIYELATNLPVNTRKLAEQYWCHWFSPVVKSMVVGHGVLLKTNGSGVPEYLVSPEGKLSSDDKLRPVVTGMIGY